MAQFPISSANALLWLIPENLQHSNGSTSPVVVGSTKEAHDAADSSTEEAKDRPPPTKKRKQHGENKHDN
jgi:hypothetical protein